MSRWRFVSACLPMLGDRVFARIVCFRTDLRSGFAASEVFFSTRVSLEDFQCALSACVSRLLEIPAVFLTSVGLIVAVMRNP